MNLLIKGGEVVDGTGDAPKKCDILINSGHIAAIGNLSSYKADRVIQAMGNYVLPGFIDITTAPETHYSLFNEPTQVNSLKQGITTIICGADGESLAPAMYPAERLLVNTGWQTMREYFKMMKTVRFGVNLASFTGYTTARQSITTKPRNLGNGEINILFSLLKKCLDDGSVGIAIGKDGLAGLDASQEEITAVIKLLTAKTKTALVSLKTEDKLYTLLPEYGIKTIISNLNESLKTRIAFDRFASSLQKITPKAEFVFAFSPYPYFQFSAQDILPPSAQKGSLLLNLKKKRISGFFAKKIKELNLQETFILNADRKLARIITGKSVAELAVNREIDGEEAFIRIIETCGEDTIFISRMKDTKIIEKIATHPKSIVYRSSQQNTPSLLINSFTESFIEFIRLSDSLGIRIEMVAKKLSSPARLFGFKRRGLIKEGFAADIVILKNNRPEVTIVNGKIAYENASLIEGRYGTIIKT